jgi:multisubunit Na+/H+ antiporter MnhG subunit
MRDTIAWVLLAAGGAVQMLSVLGVVLMRDALDGVHYLAPSGLAALLVTAAIAVRESLFSQVALYALLLAAFLLFSGPALAHATARVIDAARREREER